jgi:hypothetical protein
LVPVPYINGTKNAILGSVLDQEKERSSGLEKET